MSGHFAGTPAVRETHRHGAILVLSAAIIWSFGGMLVRFLDVTDGWTVVFWRSFFAAAFLLSFMLVRDGLRGTVSLIRSMGLPGIAVGLCFATASSCFILALSYTTVANVVLIQASVPLIAALFGWILFREQVTAVTWVAIAAVIAGVGVMVSDSLTGSVSPIGDALALLIAFAFSAATIITRRFSHVRMTPAGFFGTLVAGSLAASQSAGLAVAMSDLPVLIALGALNFGLGLALFVTGARLIPAALAALLSTAETVLAPVWVAAVHGEIPAASTVIGGAIVLSALIVYLTYDFWRQSRQTVVPPGR